MAWKALKLPKPSAKLSTRRKGSVRLAAPLSSPALGPSIPIQVSCVDGCRERKRVRDERVEDWGRIQWGGRTQAVWGYRVSICYANQRGKSKEAGTPMWTDNHLPMWEGTSSRHRTQELPEPRGALCTQWPHLHLKYALNAAKFPLKTLWTKLALWVFIFNILIVLNACWVVKKNIDWEKKVYVHSKGWHEATLMEASKTPKGVVA